MGCSQCSTAEPERYRPSTASDIYHPGAQAVRDDEPAVCSQEDPFAVECSTPLPPVKPWDGGRFRFVRKLEEACRNQGSVAEFLDLRRGNARVAVKRMPKAWMTTGPRAFARIHGDATERPWTDVAIVGHLNACGCSFTCQLIGVFVDQAFSYVVSSLASEGDLLAWSGDLPLLGRAREAAMQPLVLQLFAAVQELHDLGIAHRDISLENVLLHEDGSRPGPRVKLIDYGMATVSRHCPAGEPRGKFPYQAPEMHAQDVGYDSFLADVFALGVVTFSVVCGSYPWDSTRKGGCWRFGAAARLGIEGWLSMESNPERTLVFVSTMSDDCRDLLAGTLAQDPDRRLTLGERCWGQPRTSVWHCPWLLKLADEGSSVSTTCDTTSLT